MFKLLRGALNLFADTSLEIFKKSGVKYDLNVDSVFTFAREICGRPFSQLVAYAIVSIYYNIHHSAAVREIRCLLEWLRDKIDERDDACLTLFYQGHRPLLKFVRPAAKTFSVERFCATLWAVVKLDGWQNWGDKVLVPAHSIRMGAEWHPPHWFVLFAP